MNENFLTTEKYYECSLENFSKEYSDVEMALSSLFDNSYFIKPKGLIINNGNIDIVGIKYLDEFYFFFKVLSLEKEKDKYDLNYISSIEPYLDINLKKQFKFLMGEQNFELNKKNYDDLGMDIFNI